MNISNTFEQEIKIDMTVPREVLEAEKQLNQVQYNYYHKILRNQVLRTTGTRGLLAKIKEAKEVK